MRSKTYITANKLRQWMRETGTSEGKLALRIQITKSHISKILAGVNGVSGEVLRRLAVETNMTMEDLISK